MQALHRRALRMMSRCRLWFLDGKNAKGKIVSNPNIGYGPCMATYADEKTKEFCRIGLSANASGISVYVMGLADKGYLPKAFVKKRSARRR